MIVETATLVNTDTDTREVIEIFTPESLNELAALLGTDDVRKCDHTHSDDE